MINWIMLCVQLKWIQVRGPGFTVALPALDGGCYYTTEVRVVKNSVFYNGLKPSFVDFQANAMCGVFHNFDRRNSEDPSFGQTPY